MEKTPVPLLLLLLAATAAAGGPYSVGSHTRLGYVANAHMFDAGTNRIYSSSRDGIYAVDTGRRKTIGLVARVPAGAVAFDPASSELYVLARNEDQLRVLDVNTKKVLRTLPAPALHNVIFEPSRSELYYVRGNTNIVRIVERQKGETIATVALDGYPSFVLADPERARVIVRLYDRDLIQIIDARTHRISVSWPMVANGFSSMHVDPASGRVFLSSGKDVKMLDGLSGKELGRFSAGDLVSSIVYDAETKLVSALWGGRYVNVARVDLMTMTPLQSIDLRTPARQIFLDPRTHTLLAMGTIADSRAYGRASSPEPTAGPRISALVTLPYKSDSAPHPRPY